MEIKPIAKIYTDLPEKFGVPKQSGLVKSLTAKIVFEEEFKIQEAVRGLEDFSHIWLIWGFSENFGKWSPTVRPPRLGGNKRMGVFATRSPFRPNNLALSSVKLEKIEFTKENGPVLTVSGIDMKNETPIFDIKPYLSRYDIHEDATSGFATGETARLKVLDEGNFSDCFGDKKEALFELLSCDVRPQYQDDGRVYGLSFAGKTVKFSVFENVVRIIEVI